MPEFVENIENSLLLQVADGNETAFTRLFQAYRNKLYSFIYGISNSRPQAEDIVQEVFLKIWLNRAELKYIREFDSYLFRMARNHAINTFKRMAIETVVLGEKGQFSNNSPGLVEALEYKEMQSTLRKAIEELPERQREVFILSREHGFKQAEISRFLHITIPTVKSHITQAMHSIRKKCKNIYPIIKIYLLLVSVFLN